MTGPARAGADADAGLVAFFRPDDDRSREAAEFVRSLGAEPLADPMLAVEPTGATPRTDADYVVLTSKTGVELVADAGWTPGAATVCAIGASTADALRDAGYDADVIPDEFSSSGLVATLADAVDGRRVEVARSDHGSDVLLDGLAGNGAYVHETVLYRLVRPPESGESTRAAAAADLAAAVFTSPLTVEHFLDAAEERGVRAEAVDGLAECVVGAIGDPTAETLADYGIEVDVVPETASFEALAAAAVETAAPSYHE